MNKHFKTVRERFTTSKVTIVTRDAVCARLLQCHEFMYMYSTCISHDITVAYIVSMTCIHFILAGTLVVLVVT